MLYATQYVAGIPSGFRQGDSPVWDDLPFTDDAGTGYDSGLYTLKYTLAGPISAPLVLTAAANGKGWRTTITTVQSAALAVGKYYWQMQVSATGVRITPAQGTLLVAVDLALVGASYDARTDAEKALAAAEAALVKFQSTGGRTKRYRIGTREMEFQTDADLMNLIKQLRARVVTEKSIAGGARDRHIFMRFDNAN